MRNAGRDLARAEGHSAAGEGRPMYDQIAGYYDLLHSGLVEDIKFLSMLAEASEGPVLELGCGTGRLLLPLARKGRLVVGVDGSQVMLEIARAKIARESKAVRAAITLIRSDITGVSLPERYGLAVIGYNTAMHLGPDALTACLNSVRHHLLPGGTLFVDVDNPTVVHDPGQDGLLLLERMVFDQERDEMVVLSISSVGDGQRQTRETSWIVDASPAQGGPVRRTIARSTLHYYFAHQLQQILRTAGFDLVAQYGDYDRSAYDADESPRLLLLAQQA
jgi:SAM-dependent methyltransferase